MHPVFMAGSKTRSILIKFRIPWLRQFFLTSQKSASSPLKQFAPFSHENQCLSVVLQWDSPRRSNFGKRYCEIRVTFQNFGVTLANFASARSAEGILRVTNIRNN
jgi:hypothetical protein